MNRLETMALMGGVEVPLVALRAQLASAVDIIVQTARLRDGRRQVTHITEVAGTDPVHGYRLKDLFASLPTKRAGTTPGQSDLEPTGVLPDCLGLLRSHGLDLPASVYAVSQPARADTSKGRHALHE
jgi:pilus assembly protein CpaF